MRGAFHSASLFLAATGVGVAGVWLLTFWLSDGVQASLAAPFASPSSALGTQVLPGVATASGAALGIVHGGWMMFCGGRVAPFPAIPRPRLSRFKQLLPAGALAQRTPARAHRVLIRLTRAQ